MLLNSNKNVIVGDFTIPIIRSKRRTLSLEVSVNGVIARAPQRMSYRSIVEFVSNKQGWIEKHLNKRPSVPTPQVRLQDGAVIKLFDQPITLRLKLGLRTQPTLLNNELSLSIQQRSNHELSNSVSNKLVKWYRTVALQCLEHKAARFARPMEVSYTNIKVREYKRRWGSCDHKGNLTFNWRIIMAPETVIDYIVIHELAHLIEFNHSKQFWHIVENHMLDWQPQKNWLNQHGGSLYCVCNRPSV